MQLVAKHLAGTRGGNPLFADLSFTLNSGEGLAVTGPNGAGKSTLLRILCGLLPVSSGSVAFENDDGTPAEDTFHFLSTLNAMKDQLTAAENLQFWQQFYGSPTRTPAQALEAVNLAHVAALPFGYLSTGQKRRVAIARLLCVHRPIWLVDEPTSGLDGASEAIFSMLANDHMRAGGILIAATHLPLGIPNLQTLHLGGTS